VFGPLLNRVVGNEGGRFNSEVLMQASVLALCKFMCVSSHFCEKHLPLLFTALSNAPPEDTTLRANTVVALGDLAFRFPNEVEPYTPRLYACLRDSSTKVRRHTLMVLTHLILNDMVKVKGQVCEIALCLRDEDPRIRDMSRLLFHELSKRSNNPVYNLLPDIISKLSLLSIRKEDFRSIMSFLLGYIKKERQNEMLTEKLCQRFPKCSSMGQKADLSYCIAQLKMNEKSIKCLSDNFKLYKDALFDEDVNKSFTTIVSKAKKVIKQENRQLLEEWETKLNESANLGAENEIAGEKAANAKVRARRRATRKAKPLKAVQNEEFDFDEESVV
jgi:condensin complex subunit 1